MGSLGLLYVTPLGEGGGSVDVEVILFDRPAWALETKRRPVESPAYRVKNVVVAGHAASLRTRVDPDGSANAQYLVIELGDTVVQAQTAALIPLTPTASPLNPLLDEAAFLAVLENLRPYPE